MGPFIFIVCAELCVQSAEPEPLDQCLNRLHAYMLEHLEIDNPDQRAICQSLDPYGIALDSNGNWRRMATPPSDRMSDLPAPVLPND
jgi:hypothetical protein